ncbi:hypothetical protein AV656_01130 [Bhargavaea cecembensis]|uniref:DUF4440 domain-containing protein n=1 Tax=Bhargavaea cecembensis TaxID=394098 RepID=A0A161R9B0_9BACL|nr:DUF4440 domain-containing protein [Bhargavaea cecembensis]KZE39915.1 hypothetical protein AV656_01130 [Bhargavaea cecembensis]
MEKLTHHILKLEQELLDTSVRNDPARFGPLLHDSFIEHGQSGRRFSKADCLEGGTLGSVNLRISQFKLLPISERAVLAVYRTENPETGKTANRSSIWKSDGITWKMMFHQGTPVPSEVVADS